MTIATLRDISVVLIALEVFIMLLVPAAILFFTVRGSFWLHRKLRSVAPVVQGYFRQAAEIADRTSQKVAKPLIDVDAFVVRVRRMRDSLL